MTREEFKQESLTKIWCGMCNYFMSISEDGICGICPFKDEPSMCYDDEECDYDKFEEFIKGMKIKVNDGFHTPRQ